MDNVGQKAKDGIHVVYELAPGTYRIDEAGMVNAYLVIGEEKALLIDTGIGVGDILEVVKSITSFPLTVALTHRHADHDGGISHFDCVYAGSLDKAPAYNFLSSHFARWLLLTGAKKLDPSLKKAKLSKGKHHPRYHYIGEGFSIELGNRLINVISTPGHTRGSLVFIDAKEKIMFTGDDVNPGLWLQLPGCCNISEWLPGAKRILKLSETYRPFYGHGDGATNHEGIASLVSLAESLLKKPRKELKWGWHSYKAPDNPDLSMVISKKNIR